MSSVTHAEILKCERQRDGQTSGHTYIHTDRQTRRTGRQTDRPDFANKFIILPDMKNLFFLLYV